MMLYIRKNDDIKLPHLVGEFSYCGSLFIFAIPFSSKPQNDNLKESNFLGLCKHYQTQPYYSQSYNIDEDKYFEQNINMQCRNTSQ